MIPTVSLTPAQLLYAMVALLRALGLLPQKPAPDEHPEDPGFVSLATARTAAHAYVQTLGLPPQQRQIKDTQIERICSSGVSGIFLMPTS